MNGTQDETPAPSFSLQTDFDKVTTVVSGAFQVEEALIDHDIPTYYLKQPQETKRAFMQLLKNLESMKLIAILRKQEGRIVLRVIPKPATKPSNVLINWILLFATIGTTFLTGYLLSPDITDPFIGGATFTIALMAILGLHELGHKISANRKGVEATPPYFIPGPPPIGGFFGIGTFGALILQKSLPPNKDSLFDIGASGPVMSFLLATVATVIGLLVSPVFYSADPLNTIPAPLLFMLLADALVVVPAPPPNMPYAYILLHPVAVAGWVGMLVTMLNLVPAAMLDGGHVARSIFGEKARAVLTVLSIISLAFISPVMAIFVLFLALQKHPGPLDDVSGLSRGRKLATVGLVTMFVLSSFLQYLVFLLQGLLGV